MIRASLILTIINTIFPLVFIPIVLRIIAAEDYGFYVLINSIQLFFQSIFIYSMSNYFIRECAAGRRVVEFINVQVVMGCASVISALVFISLTVYESLDKEIFLYIAISSFSALVNFEWVYFYRNKISYLIKRNLIIKVLSLFMIFKYVNDESDFHLFWAIMTFSTLVSNLISLLGVREKISLSVNIRSIVVDIRKSKYFIFNNTLGVFSQFFDQMLIGLMLGTSDLAKYSIIKTIYNAALSIFQNYNRMEIRNSSLAFSNFERSHDVIKKIIFNNISLGGVLLLVWLFFGKLILNAYAGDKYVFYELDVYLMSSIAAVIGVQIIIDNIILTPLELERITFFSNILVVLVFSSLVLSGLNAHGIYQFLEYQLLSQIAGLVVMIFLVYKRVLKAHD